MKNLTQFKVQLAVIIETMSKKRLTFVNVEAKWMRDVGRALCLYV